MTRLRTLDWEALAGIAAAVMALMLHLLHVVEQDVLLAVALVILALILLRGLRAESRAEGSIATAERTLAEIEAIRVSLSPADVLLIGPRDLRRESERFARRAQGEMVWFNVCLLMFAPQDLFDALLKPAIENPRVTGVQFILDQREQERWHSSVQPKVAACSGRDKVREPLWATLSESSSFILAQTGRGLEEAQLSFWGEPFMSRSAGVDIPRYVFHVQPHSELIGRLSELARHYRLTSA